MKFLDLFWCYTFWCYTSRFVESTLKFELNFNGTGVLFSMGSIAFVLLRGCKLFNNKEFSTFVFA